MTDKKPTAEDALHELRMLAVTLGNGRTRVPNELAATIRAELDRLRAENRRLSDWLMRIGGGDPQQDHAVLMRWAYEALVLRRECP